MRTSAAAGRRAAAWLGLGALGFAAPAWVGLLILGLALGLWLLGGRRPRRRDVALVAPAAVLALAGLGGAAFGSWRHPIPVSRFQSLAEAAYERYWGDLEEHARVAAEAVIQRTELRDTFDATAAFAALSSAGANSRHGVLLIDGDGVVVAWGGSGLLREPEVADPRRGRSIRASFGSTTFFVARPFGTGAGDWSVVAGQSVATPELPFRLPGGVVATHWTTAPYESEAPGFIPIAASGAPTLWIDRSRSAAPAWIERARRFSALPWGLALLGLAAIRAVGSLTLLRTVLRRRARPLEAAALSGGGAFALATGCGADAGVAALAGVGALGAVVTMLGALWTEPPRLAWVPRVGFLVSFGLATWWAVRRTAHSPLGSEPERLAADGWLAFALASLALGALGSLVLRRSGAREATPVGRAATLALLAAVVAAGTYQLAARARVAARSATSVAPLPLAAAVEASLASTDLAALGPAPLDRLDAEDLAFVLWSRTPLRLHDLRSALVVDLADGRRSTFSLGLPLSGAELDRSPALWRDLGLASVVDSEDRSAPTEGSAVLHAGAEPLGTARFWLLGDASAPAAPMSAADVRRRLLLGRGRAGTETTNVARADANELLAQVDRAGTQALVALAFGGLLLLVGVAFALPLRAFRDRLRQTWRSYSMRLVFVVTLLAVLPVLAINLVVIQAFAARLEREQRSSGEEALRAAQRVLGEYVDTLAPGFSLDTVLNDDLLRWLGRVVQRDINLYWGSRLYATSQPELFSTALLPRRIPAEVYSLLALGGATHASRTNRVAGQTYLELYAPFGRSSAAPARAPQMEVLTLSVPLVAQQEDLERETAALRRRALVASAAFFVLFVAVGARAARNFTRPLRELVAGTRRIAAGARSLELRPSDTELETLVIAVDQMAAQIADSREQLRRGERLEAWAEMARMIAHEIKNPLTPIRLSAEHMREVYERDPERFAPVFQRCVDNILRQVEELRSIAIEFSTYSSIPRIALERVELGGVLRDAVDAYDSGAGARPVRLDAGAGDLAVRLDPRLFVRALRNVLENALRVSGGAPVEVVARREGDQARVDVLDRGPGVGVDMLERIFDPYFSTHEGGTGLGLPIARRILEEHGGKLWAERRDGGGLRVSMTLPCVNGR